MFQSLTLINSRKKIPGKIQITALKRTFSQYPKQFYSSQKLLFEAFQLFASCNLDKDSQTRCLVAIKIHVTFQLEWLNVIREKPQIIHYKTIPFQALERNGKPLREAKVLLST